MVSGQLTNDDDLYY
jgi:hypothetical protein